jgi:hypothetical protein
MSGVFTQSIVHDDKHCGVEPSQKLSFQYSITPILQHFNPNRASHIEENRLVFAL